MESIPYLLAADVPVLLWAGPGTGKTEHIRALARRAGAHVETLIGSTLDPTDVAGRPVLTTDGHVRVAPPEWALRARAALDRERPCWLFFDELSTAPPAVQAACLRIVYERRVGDLDLSGARVVGAANDADTAADGGWLAPAMALRWCHLEWRVSADAWVRGETSGWLGDPRPLELRAPTPARVAAARALIAAYIARNPAALLASPVPTTSRGAACPRAWSALGRVLGALAADDDMVAAAKSAVGRKVAHGLVGADADGWLAWADSMDLVDPETVLMDPRAKLPKRGDQLAAVLLAVAAAAITERADRPARIGQAWRALARVRPDQALMAGAALLDAWPDVPDEAQSLGAMIIETRARLG